MKVEFVTQLRVTKNNGKWVLLCPFVVKVDGSPWVIPTEFETDFASVPRVPFAYLLAGDTAHKSAVFHDFLYEQQVDRKWADGVFYYAYEPIEIIDKSRITGLQEERK